MNTSPMNYEKAKPSFTFQGVDGSAGFNDTVQGMSPLAQHVTHGSRNDNHQTEKQNFDPELFKMNHAMSVDQQAKRNNTVQAQTAKKDADGRLVNVDFFDWL